MTEPTIRIPVPGAAISATLALPETTPSAMVVITDGDDLTRSAPPYRLLTSALTSAGFGTLAADLLTAHEAHNITRARQARADTDLLAWRLAAIASWLNGRFAAGVAIFASGGARPVAMLAARRRPDLITAIACTGGEPIRTDTCDIAPVLSLVSHEEATPATMPSPTSDAEAVVSLPANVSNPLADASTCEPAAQTTVRWFRQHIPGQPAGETTTA